MILWYDDGSKRHRKCLAAQLGDAKKDFTFSHESLDFGPGGDSSEGGPATIFIHSLQGYLVRSIDWGTGTIDFHWTCTEVSDCLLHDLKWTL